MNTLRSRAWLVAPSVVLWAADIALTLAGQSAAYWAGDYGQARESNPLAYPLLAASPWVFVGATALWGAAVSGVVLFWRHWATPWIGVLSALGHAIGGSSWLVRLGAGAGWGLAVAYLLLASQASRWCWRRAGWLTAP